MDDTQMKQFEHLVCPIRKVVAIQPNRRAIVVPEGQDVYSSYTDDETDETEKTSVLSGAVECILNHFGPKKFYTVRATECVTRQLCRAVQPRIVLVLGHKSSQYKDILHRASSVCRSQVLNVSGLLKEAIAQSRVTSCAAVSSSLMSEMARAFHSGKPVPIEQVVSVIRHRILHSPAIDTFIVDGYPRVIAGGFPYAHDQLLAFYHQVGYISKVQ